MSLGEFKSVFFSIKYMPDLIFFDACLMQMVEVNFEIRNMVKMVVGSEEIEWSGESMYAELFNKLSNEYASRRKAIYLDTVSSEIVRSYERFVSDENLYPNYTISAVEPEDVAGDLTSEINLFANALINEINSGHGDVIREIISDTQPMHVSTKMGISTITPTVTYTILRRE